MARVNHIVEEIDDSLLDRKAKRRLVKTRAQQQQQQANSASSAESSPADDIMSRIALLCQEQRWREALLLCLQGIAKAESEGRGDAALGLRMASQKIECSLRRQMAAAFIVSAKNLLNKEYLLDVC
ncbi:MAG: hypothetical protein GX946_02950 [Oligosphaeraceae bacterium]|nr:hypothetical protein [Oligosphaeraceae bacterium]